MAEMVHTQAPVELLRQRLHEADRLIAQARGAAQAKHAGGALQLYRQALAAIGTFYVGPGLRDDTDTKLMLAEESAEAGRTEQALTLYDRIATARATLLREKTTR